MEAGGSLSGGPAGEGADVFAGIGWHQPWLAAWREPGEPAARCVAQGASVADVLDACRVLGEPAVRFAPQHDLPAGTPYESHIFRTGRVPTRDNLHDFFNGLCWLRFPATKRRLNALQAARIEAHGIGPSRGPLRDAVTLFDENAALLVAPQPLWDALAARQWRRLFGELRPLWRRASVTTFGHALVEKLVLRPHKAVTAHVYRWPGAQPQAGEAAGLGAATLDAMLAAGLHEAHLAAKPFLPLPVLGVPGWCAANEDPSFYEDARVFRAARAP